MRATGQFQKPQKNGGVNMFKKALCILFVAAVLLCGCGKNVDSSASAALPPEETVQSLFEEAAGIIRDYVVDESDEALDADFDGKAFKKIDGGYTLSGLEKSIDGIRYYKTELSYQQAVDYYSEIFTGEALDSFLSRYFYDVDGNLYVKSAGSMTGFGIDHIEITYMSQSGGEYFYQVAYDDVAGFEEITFSPDECHFSVKNVDGDYRISSIDYLSDFYFAFLPDYYYTD